MTIKSICPVPIEQRPSQEFIDLTKSWFFVWPLKGEKFLFRSLVKSWLLFIPISIVINSGNWSLKHDNLHLILISLIGSLLIPLILLIRQLLCWNYLQSRLLLETIDYEESGWYDGQKWEKTLEFRTQDLLIAQHEVKPLMIILKKALKISILIFASTLCIYILI